MALKFLSSILTGRSQSLDSARPFQDDADTPFAFKEHYREHILPHVERFEARRLQALQDVVYRGFFAVVICAFFAVLLQHLFSLLEEQYYAFIIVPLLIVAGMLIKVPKRRTPRIIITIVTCLLFFPFVFWCIGATYRYEDSADFFVRLLTFFALIYAAKWAYNPVKNYKTNAKKELFPSIFKFFGKNFKYSLNCPIRPISFYKSGIVPFHTLAVTSD